MIKKIRYAPFPTYQERFYMLSIKYTIKALVQSIQKFFKVIKVTLVKKINNLNTNPKIHRKLR